MITPFNTDFFYIILISDMYVLVYFSIFTNGVRYFTRVNYLMNVLLYKMYK